MAQIESRIAELFRAKRKESGLGYKKLAKRAGYRNLDKGMRRMRNLESSDSFFPHPEIRETFAEVLNITEDEIEDAMRKDFEALDQPIEPQLIIRIMAAVYVEGDLPEGCRREEAIEIAEKVATERNRKCCLTLSRIRGIYFETDGTSHEEYSLPAAGIGSRSAEMRFQKAVDEFTQDDGIEADSLR